MSVIDQAIRRAEAILAAVKGHGVEFEIRHDGKVWGGLSTGKARKTPRKSPFPRGEMIGYYKPLLEDMVAGETRHVPFDKFGANTLQSSIASWANTTWGDESYITHRVHDGVEVLRVK